MRIDLVSLFPEMFASVLGSSILKRAAEPVADPAAPDDPSRIRPPVCSYHLHNPRDYADNKHAKVDQSPYGGGAGMVLQCQPIYDCVAAAEAVEPQIQATRVVMTPKGRPLTQKLAEELAGKPRLIIIAGHYEGFDQRVIDELGPVEVSLGDYVLTGGELPAMVLVDAIVRLIPNAIGKSDSAHHDSFSPGSDRLLDHPHYTRPPQWRGRAVPDVLISGDHKKIEAWRREQSLAMTRERRPDLLVKQNPLAPSHGDARTPLAVPVILREALPVDHDAIDALLKATFETPAEAALVQRLREQGDAPIEILAEVDGQVVGGIVFSPVTLDDGDGRFRALGLAPLAVLPEFQKRGIGKALVRYGLKQCEDARLTGVFVLGEPGYYGPLGFEKASGHGFTNTFGADDAFGVKLFKPVEGVKGLVRFAPAFEGL